MVAARHEGAQGSDLVALRGQRGEAVAVGAQEIREHVGVGSVALGAMAAVARPGGLDRIRMDRYHVEAGVDQRIDDQPGRALDGDARAAEMPESALQPGKAIRIVLDVEAFTHLAAFIDDSYGVDLTGPVQPGKEVAHGQAPVSCGMTCRAGSPRGSLTDRRSRLHTSALHPVARLGLPAPRRLRVSCGLSRSQRDGQSPRGHGSRSDLSSQSPPSVKPIERRVVQ
ncbi:MAG: hypothetical protein BroJett026_24380 [Betaproteobacteria bacterium]|nr:MAG: hypothetical protein BroJett026_24380 [Betaproteobacteria bacterium]